MDEADVEAEAPPSRGRPPLPPELERLRRIDQAMHVAAAKAAGLEEAQAEAHAREHLEERARDAYRGPRRPPRGED